MVDSVFDNISLRELYGNRFRNQTCELSTFRRRLLTKYVPSIISHSSLWCSSARSHFVGSRRWSGPLVQYLRFWTPGFHSR
ncbi:hypothetical protein FGIG_07890 [Fasciola gigantica]|uniref:Uncharacterized protein n=1 Tax=Fasciola gigantica TaxID=46835 RepID=A0A504Z0Y4_FASGI|nr:hypothetical protein FGIG_07890 [Fasciola gigantica]